MAQTDVQRSLAFSAPAAPPGGQTRRPPARNVIFFLGDGLGITTVRTHCDRELTSTVLYNTSSGTILNLNSNLNGRCYMHFRTTSTSTGFPHLCTNVADCGACVEGGAPRTPRRRGGARARLVRPHRTREGAHFFRCSLFALLLWRSDYSLS